MTVENILACYESKYPESYISTAKKNIPVYWGHYSIVQAELNCLHDLMNNEVNNFQRVIVDKVCFRESGDMLLIWQGLR